MAVLRLTKDHGLDSRVNIFVAVFAADKNNRSVLDSNTYFVTYKNRNFFFYSNTIPC